MLKNFTVEVQKFFLEVMLTDASCFVRVQGIFNPENFDRSLRAAAQFLYDHAEEYKSVPTFTQISAVADQEFQKIDDLTEQHIEWFFDEFEKFSRRQELERAILKSADLLEKGEYDPVEKLIKDAVQVGLVRDMGTDYFADPKARLAALRNQNGQVSSGWPSLDVS